MPKINQGYFYESIQQAISENRHKEYLQEVIRKYEEYEEKFNQFFTKENHREYIYTLHVTYLLKKAVWRDIEIFGKQTFLDLAEKIIDSMGWDNDHMHGFEIPNKEQDDPLLTGSSFAFFAPGWEDDPHPTFKTNEIQICNFDYKKLPKLDFTFDFGDDHKFEVEFIKIRKCDNQEKTKDFPKVIDQRGVAPEQYPDYE